MPHPGQRAVRVGRRRFTWLAAGRRWRKTTLFVALCVEAHASGQTIVWGAPTYDQVFTAWEEMRRAARGAMVWNQSRMTATLGRGAIQFRSLDNPDNARGKTADGIVIDECGDVTDTAWSEVLRPMLMDTGGWLLAGGTPKGRNWFWRECMAARDGALDSVFFQAPTLGVRITASGLAREPHPLENPGIPYAEVEHLHRTMSERSFRQEILAEFLEDGGGVFRNVRACATAEVQGGAQDGHVYVIGVDWGRTGDATVITVLDVTARAVALQDRFTQTDYHTQTTRLRGVWERFGRCGVYVEQNSMGGPLLEHLSREGVTVRGFVTTNATKAAIIDALALAFERQDIRIPDDAGLIAELEAFEAQTLPSGAIRFSAPQGIHDDRVMSLAIAWHYVGRASSAVGAFSL